MHEEVLEHAPALLAFLLQVQMDGLEMHLQHKSEVKRFFLIFFFGGGD